MHFAEGANPESDFTLCILSCPCYGITLLASIVTVDYILVQYTEEAPLQL